MIWALLALWFFSGGGSHTRPFSIPVEQAVALVQQHVAEPARRAQAVQVLESMAELEQERGEALAAFEKDLQKLIDDRSASRDTLLGMGEAEQAKGRTYQDRMIELRFQLKQHLTAAEWALVFPAPAASP